ncbi:MAG: type II secretion system protein [Sedimentisphaerales bacterium]|nr:type II secretion system protein [Sedimentisphaerales bacterium]
MIIGDNKKAFSLVELLVVISIIALLMGILMPALAAARSGARELVCKSNVRQLLLANIGHASDNDGFYVAAASDMWSGPGLHRWHGVRKSLSEPFEAAGGPLASYLAGGQVKQCPERVDFIRSDDWAASFEKGCGGYGYNMTYIGSRTWNGVGSGIDGFKAAYERTARATEVAKPAQTVMFADTAMSKDGKSYIEYSFAEPPYTVYGGKVMTSFYMSPSIHFRHRGRANVGWVEGSVESREMADVELASVYGVDSGSMNIGWFDPADNSLFDLD